MAIEATRPRILDRNGQVMALDIETQSLFAEPKLIERAQETYDKAQAMRGRQTMN